jgi:hypothetical protein
MSHEAELLHRAAKAAQAEVVAAATANMIRYIIHE